MDHLLAAEICAERATGETAATKTLAASLVGVKTPGPDPGTAPVRVCCTVVLGTNRQCDHSC